MYIDNKQFAIDKLSLSGELDVVNCSRVTELYENISGKINYSITGSCDTANRLILKVSICGIINTLCQNCLDDISLTIEHYSAPVIFDDEAMMDSALFDSNEVDDAILADSEFNVLEFIEDELILLIPISPRHNSCITGVVENKSTNPFQSLKNLIN